MYEDAAPASQSFFSWAIQSVGLTTGILLLVTAAVSTLIALLVVLRGRGPMAVVAVLLAIPAPFVIGLIATVLGMINAYAVVAQSATAPKPSELADGVSTSLFSALAGLILVIPGLLVATFASVIRSLTHTQNVSHEI